MLSVAVSLFWTFCLFGATSAHVHQRVSNDWGSIANPARVGINNGGVVTENIARDVRSIYKARHRSSVSSAEMAVNVDDFGAIADGKTDNTKAFQSALDYVGNWTGGIVDVPTGLYYFKGTLTIPSGVTLKGSYVSVPSHSHVLPTDDVDGSILMPTFGRGDDAVSKAFINIVANAAMQGFTVYYPNQKCDGSIPVAYPPTVYMYGNNAAITDVELLNSWIGINATQAHRHYIARIQGQPSMIGVYVDETYDIGRIEDVHFNPWFCNDKEYTKPQSIYGRSFVMGRSDWEYVFNTFSFGYAVGYHFIETSTGSMNGNFLGIGADLSFNASILVDASQPMGLLITNGEFTSFKSDKFGSYSTAVPTQVIVSSTNSGAVQFVNSAFWGPTESIARLYGSGTTTFADCVFVQWDLVNNNGAPALYSNNGNLILSGNQFLENKKQIKLDSGVKKAVIVGNIVSGSIHFDIANDVTTAQSANV